MTSARRERGGTSRSWPFFFSLSVERLRNGAEDMSCTSLIRAGIGKKKARRNTDRKTSGKKEECRGRWRGDGGAQVFLRRSKPKLSLLKWTWVWLSCGLLDPHTLWDLRCPFASPSHTHAPYLKPPGTSDNAHTPHTDISNQRREKEERKKKKKNAV